MIDVSDPYLYPGTNVLRNVPGFHNSGDLESFEAIHTALRTYELLRKPIGGAFDVAYLRAIHKHVFQDVFPWTGEFRSTMLGKAGYPGEEPAWFTVSVRRSAGLTAREFGSTRRTSMRRAHSLILALAACLPLAGCYYDPDYGYVRNGSGADAYYGEETTTVVSPGVYDPGYGYYGYPAYYDYGPGPYAYYGGPYYYRHRYWRHRHYW